MRVGGIAWPERPSCNTWIVWVAAQLTPRAKVIQELARNFPMGEVPIKVVVKSSRESSSVQWSAQQTRS
jgi:hypothetical protein